MYASIRSGDTCGVTAASRPALVALLADDRLQARYGRSGPLVSQFEQSQREAGTVELRACSKPARYAECGCNVATAIVVPALGRIQPA